MRKSLNLAGDGDELDLIADVENTFAIKFANADFEDCWTAGDLNEIVWRRISGRADAGNVRCMNAMAFHALRRAIVAAGGPRKIRPPDRLQSLGITPKQLSKAIRQQTGFSLGFARGRLGTVAEFVMLPGVLCILAGIKWHALLIAAVPFFACGLALFRLDRGSYKGCETVADAAARIVADNFGALVDKGARFDAKSVWLTLQEAMSLHGDCPANEIGPDTLLIHP